MLMNSLMSVVFSFPNAKQKTAPYLLLLFCRGAVQCILGIFVISFSPNYCLSVLIMIVALIIIALVKRLFLEGDWIVWKKVEMLTAIIIARNQKECLEDSWN